jgi:hypothetical protein
LIQKAGVSIVPSQESEQTCVYMCGRGINCTFFLTIFRLDFGTVTTTKKNYVKRNKIVSIVLMTSLDVQLIPLPHMYTHVCSLS